MQIRQRRVVDKSAGPKEEEPRTVDSAASEMDAPIRSQLLEDNGNDGDESRKEDERLSAILL